MDYGAEPPEVNSGRMYAGVGSGPLVAAAAAWQALAAELGAAAAAYGSMISTLVAGSWLGPSSIAMVSAAMPYVAWMAMTAAQCEEHAMATAATAGAFETAFMGVIPPPMIAENRSELAALVASNILGQNTPAIAANQAEYAEFWAQDSSTLFGYAGEVSGILGSLMPFMPPVLNTDPAGLAAQAASVGESAGQSAGQAGQTVSGVGTTMPGTASAATSMLSAGPSLVGMIPQALQGLTSPMSSLTSGGGLTSLFGQFQSLMGPLLSMGTMSQFTSGLSSSLGSGLGSLTSLPSLGSTANLGGYTAAMGRAPTIGMGSTKLSVPASWASSNSPSSSLVKPLLTAESEAAPSWAGAAPQAGMVPAAGAGMGSGSPGFQGTYPQAMMGSLGKENDPRSRRPKVTEYIV